LFAILAVFGALLCASIFLLTNPPAYDRISEEARPWIGLLLLVVPIGFALKEIDAVFIKRKKMVPVQIPAEIIPTQIHIRRNKRRK
jgi:hypothetical protein